MRRTLLIGFVALAGCSPSRIAVLGEKQSAADGGTGVVDSPMDAAPSTMASPGPMPSPDAPGGADASFGATDATPMHTELDGEVIVVGPGDGGPYDFGPLWWHGVPPPDAGPGHTYQDVFAWDDIVT